MLWTWKLKTIVRRRRKNVYTFQKKPVILPQEHNGWKNETVFLLGFELCRIGGGGGGGAFFFSYLLFCFSVDGYWLQKEVLLTYQIWEMFLFNKILFSCSQLLRLCVGGDGISYLCVVKIGTGYFARNIHIHYISSCKWNLWMWSILI